jgi:hypothetical protein
MVLDFALSYSDDWFLLPMALDAWSLFEATEVAVTDVFGDVTVAGPPASRWNLFRLHSSRTRFTLERARTQRPAGQVLAELRASRQLLHQSEVRPEGAQVSRRWQSARAIDGTLHFWIGRSKTPRLTDTAPAVRFDVVEYR